MNHHGPRILRFATELLGYPRILVLFDRLLNGGVNPLLLLGLGKGLDSTVWIINFNWGYQRFGDQLTRRRSRRRFQPI
jgi:hypothetical protein